MQTQWHIKAPDGAMIYGVTDMAGPQPADKLFVMCHGLTGHMNEQQFHAAPDYFNPLGYDVLRFNFYGGGPRARMLDECTIARHAADLQTVLDEHAGAYKSVFVCGHSFGGLTLAYANPQNVTAVSLWDPSFDTDDIFSDERNEVQKTAEGYLLGWGARALVGLAMYDEVATFDGPACAAMVSHYHSPLQVIWAGGDEYAKSDASYHSYAPEPAELVVIDGAMHCFNEPGTRDALFAATHGWFERFAA